MSPLAIIIFLLINISLVSSRPYYSKDPQDGGSSVKLDDVSVRRVGFAGISSIPTSLWPLPRRRMAQGHTSNEPNIMLAYNLIWLPGGAVKIMPRVVYQES